MGIDADENAPEYAFAARRWECALDLSNKALGALREVFPVHTWQLSETGSRAIDASMQNLTSAIMDLHRAGPHVLGRDPYDRMMEERSERAAVGATERGDL